MTALLANNDAPKSEWFTAAELAALTLPGLPSDKRGMARRAQEERWTSRSHVDGSPLYRPRKGRGGGVEFHVSILPGTARLEMARRGLIDIAPTEAKTPTNQGGWAWFEVQSAKVKAEAERRLAIVNEVEALTAAGVTKSGAVGEVCKARGVGSSTLWAWLSDIDGLPASERLPALAPRRTGGGKKADMAAVLWGHFKSNYLRGSEPTLTSCYRGTAKVAAERGLSMPSEKTFRRRLEREIDPAILIMRRKGEEALRRSVPAIRRRVEAMHAMQCVNIDGHKFDVFVQHPEGGDKKPIRPILVALQDVRSSKIVAWRMGETESADLARLVFADLFRDYGIPAECVLDNGRGFASKMLTGGAKTRFRFKILPSDPTGLLTSLGIIIHWATPYRGQSKPIERAWRDLCDTVARAPECEGAYTGNNTQNKPHNYGKKVMEWDAFQALVEREIKDHNARLGRRGRDYRGRSFDDVFNESYARAPIAKATDAQLRMALLAADQKFVNRQDGTITLFGNRYWSVECGRLKGQRVTVRFDPDNLHSQIYLYEAGGEGAYLGAADCLEDFGFLTAEGAKVTKKRWTDFRKRARDGLAAERLLSAEEVAAMMPDTIAPETPEPGALRLVRHKQTAGDTKAAMKILQQEKPAHDAENDIVAALGNLRIVE